MYMIGGVQRRMVTQIMNLFESENIDTMKNDSNDFEDLTE